MYRFATTRRWVVLHVVVLVVTALFALAGKWQLDRLHQKREHNALVRSRLALPVVPMSEVARSPSAPYRRVTISGRYDESHEVVLLGRQLATFDGNNVLTPLVTDDGKAVLVNRGWVPPPDDHPGTAALRPPSGRVEITGILVATEGRGPFTPPVPERTTTVGRIDVAGLLAREKPRTALDASVYLLMRAQSPRQAGALPKPGELPPLDEGPHLSYAIQWFAFMLISIVGYTVLLRREAQRSRGLLSSAPS